MRPKPMVEIGGKPMLWHIMKIYAAHGIDEFVICLGYKGYLIKEYFANYYLHTCDVTFDLAERRHGGPPLGDRALARDARRHRRGDDDRRAPASACCPTSATRTSASPTATASPTSTSRRSIAFHREQGTRATVTAVQPPGRFGALDVDGERVREFEEKPRGDGGWINGGFFVLSPEVARYIDGDDTVWEQEPMRALAREGQLACYRHEGFWQAMDTLRDRNHLEELWSSGAPRGGRGRSATMSELGSAPTRPSTRPSGATAACSSPATRASRARGWRCGCSRSARSVTGLLARACRRSPSLYELARVGEGMESDRRRHPRPRGGRARRSPRAGRRSSSTWPRSRSCAARSPSRARPTRRT